jgi:PAS domain S-box-containing protein
MAKGRTAPGRRTELRKRADTRLEGETIDSPELSPQEVRKLVYELRTHQVQLEMQNEELRRIQDELVESRDRYADFYDFSPVGYVTISPKNLILEANLALADMLGVERGTLVNQPISAYILPDDKDILYLHLRMVRESKQHDTCHLRMLRRKAEPIWAEMDSILVEPDDESGAWLRTVIRDITQRKELDERLRRSEREWRKTFDAMSDWVTLVDEEGNIKRSNRAGEKFTGLPVEDIVGRNCCFLVHGQQAHRPGCPLCHAVKSKTGGQLEFQLPDTNRWLLVTVDPFPDEIEHISGAIHIVRDITERKQAEQVVSDSLKEKELLLREIHHRVKNNMQIISSLINLQSDYIRDRADAALMKEFQNRIRSMSLVHEKLYRSEDLTRVDFRDYVRDLVKHLFQMYQIDPNRVVLEAEIDRVNLDIDHAISCGLLINELISNCLKHAFPDGRRGHIAVIFRPAGTGALELIVKDDGVGLPDTIDIRKSETFGLQLVIILAEKQLHGQVSVERDQGTTFSMKLKV